MPSEPTLTMVLGALLRRPGENFLRRWNWKSALLSSLVRSLLFFAANLSAGPAAARAALLTELAYRGATAGFHGALTQALREARPAWAGTLAALVLLPLAGHGVEFLVHHLRGTARLADSLALSVSFTVLSTAFNLFAMRRGALIVGAESRSLWCDLRRTPALFAAFVVEAAAGPARGARRLSRALRSRTLRKRAAPAGAAGRP